MAGWIENSFLLNNMAYSTAAFLFGVVLSVFLWIRYQRADATLRAFRAFVTATTIGSLVDVFASYAVINCQQLPAAFVMFINTVSCLTTSTCAFLLVGYVHSYVKNPRVIPKIFNGILVIINYLMHILNLFFGFYYYIDENHEFIHGRFYV